MEEHLGGIRREKLDKKLRSNLPETQDYSNQGGLMVIDSIQREHVDSVAEEYGVNLRYDEGKVHVYGERREIENFVDEVLLSEKVMEGENHPTEFSVFSELEEDEIDEGKGIITDGGKDYQTLEDVSHTSPNYDGVDGVQETRNLSYRNRAYVRL